VTQAVADRSSNKNDQLVHAAEVIGRSEHKLRVFKAIYTGKKRSKTVSALMTVTRLSRIRVLDAGKSLADNDLILASRDGRETTYQKVPFFQRYRDRVIALASNRRSRDKLPTKRGRSGSSVVTIKISARQARASHVTIDDIESFRRVRSVPADLGFVRMSETSFKNGVAAILGERGTFSDWGGELRDLSSTRLKLKGRRRAAAFAFKGPGKTGRLVPGKMGKNGDQIQRLVRCPAEVFLVQYWQEIDDAVLEQLEKLVQLKAAAEGRVLWYGVIDGQDSARIIQAYRKHFKVMRRTF